MKKTLFIIAACALVAVSCQKESALENEIKTEGIITVTADIAQFGGDTKTSINGSAETPKPLWSSSDQIKLFDSAGKSAIYTLSAGAGQAVGTFTQTSAESGFAIANFACAYYPAANATAYAASTGITATIPATQAYTTANSDDEGTNSGTFAPGADPMVGTGTFDYTTGNLGLTFKNVFGILQLNFTGTSETIKQIDVIGAANLSGTATITIDGDGTPTCTISSGQKYVTLTGVNQTLEALNSKAFYIAVPAGTISKIYVTTTTELQYSGVKSIEITRSNITSKKSATLSVAGFKAVTYSEAPTLAPTIIRGTVWAPVNCGYEPATTSPAYKGYPYGKLYQWGRYYGCGYTATDATSTDNDACSLQTNTAKNTQTSLAAENSAMFYLANGDWNSDGRYYNLWDSSISSECKTTGHVPTKNTDRDPCPTGWRVPAYAELYALIGSAEISTGFSLQTYNGQKGHWFDGAKVAASENSGLFLPAAGRRHGNEGTDNNRGSMGYYWCSSAEAGNSPWNAWYLYFESGKTFMYGHIRTQGNSIRCVLVQD